MIKIIKEERYPAIRDEGDTVIATIRVPKREWLKFKTHLEKLERVEAKRKEIFAELIGLDYEG